MDSARDFDLRMLGESVPQVPVSARKLVLLFQCSYHLTPFFLTKYLYSSSTLEGGPLICVTGCPLGAGKYVRVHLGGRCVKGTWNIFR